MLEKTEKEQFWRLVLEEHARSGLSAREFCRRESISEPSFYAWRRRVRERDIQASSGWVPGKGRQVAFVNDHQLVPVTVVESGTTARLSSVQSRSDSRPERDSRLEIVTSSGGVLRIDESCSVEVIRRALVAMRLADGEGVSC